jgi:aminomethyltransferase
VSDREVPLGPLHRRLGARMVPFAGYQLPLQYSSIRAEHQAVRERAGLFDVSHMGEVRVDGPGAPAYLQRLVTNDVGKLEVGQALYTVMCREDGGIVDDLLVYRDPDGYMCVVNAARHDDDLTWMRHQLPPSGVELEDQSDQTCLLALQGPLSLQILEPLADGAELAAIPYYHHQPGRVLGVPVRISRTGYTGEDGFELYCDREAAEGLFQGILDRGRSHGLLPAGLGARDTLRLEAGFRLYGQDITLDRNPISAGLGWVVKLDKGDFVGREALVQAKAQPQLSFIGLRLLGRGIPRPHQVIQVDGEPIGEVTSGSYGFSVGAGIAMGYVRPGSAPKGSEVEVMLRADPAEAGAAQVVSLPFYRRPT